MTTSALGIKTRRIVPHLKQFSDSQKLPNSSKMRTMRRKTRKIPPITIVGWLRPSEKTKRKMELRKLIPATAIMKSLISLSIHVKSEDRHRK